jgi:hypothetical protein
MKPVILILEDHEPRVDFVRELFGAFSDIEWHVSVREFLMAVESVKHERVVAAIWDHDLGEVGHNRDADGLKGIHAARAVEMPRHIYQLVWSINPSGSVDIEKTLQSRGYSNVERIEAKTQNRPMLAARLTSAFLVWKRGYRIKAQEQTTFSPKRPGCGDLCKHCGKAEGEHRWRCATCDEPLPTSLCGCGSVHMPAKLCAKGCGTVKLYCEEA